MYVHTSNMSMPSQIKTGHNMHHRSPQPTTNTNSTLPKLHRIVHRIHILPLQILWPSPHTQTHQVWSTNRRTKQQWMEYQPLRYNYRRSQRSYTRESHRTTNRSKSPKNLHQKPHEKTYIKMPSNTLPTWSSIKGNLTTNKRMFLHHKVRTP